MKPRAAVLLLALAGLSGGAAAQACSASATGIAFGAVDPMSVVATDATGSVTVTCGSFLITLTLGYTVSASAGDSGSYGGRRMSAGAAQLDYQLYRDALRSSVWGDGTGGSAAISGSLLLSILVPVSATHTIYGRVPGSQPGAAAGSYGDTLTVTVTY